MYSVTTCPSRLVVSPGASRDDDREGAGPVAQFTPPSLAANGTHRPNTQPRGLRWWIGWRLIRCGEVRDPSTAVDEPARRYPQTPIITTRPLPDYHHSAPRGNPGLR